MTDVPHGPFAYEDFAKGLPAAHAALIALGKAVDETGLEKLLTELVKLRVSQINGCAFCLGFHLNLARKLGLDGRKLDLVAAWREVDLYSPRERAALAWAERLTLQARLPVPPADAAEIEAAFSKSEILALTVSIATINAWNRIAGALAFPPPA
ncbi:carboxymuconolactone decarboxylase family protein [Oryzibacter oryziterrae]|uniref:carboxymuconolactone decarboxylase family protein n=1 Tax=Oryzibacter oryziterrae TaxID=2766474 RepID=UPI001F256B98|nr:carboxymuconolactone decarboxylase family protein [Oryzibacter oryziterrae]